MVAPNAEKRDEKTEACVRELFPFEKCHVL